MLSSYKLKSLKTRSGRDNLVNPKEEMPIALRIAPNRGGDCTIIITSIIIGRKCPWRYSEPGRKLPNNNNLDNLREEMPVAIFRIGAETA